MSIRLLICDDHEVIRTGLATLLAGTDIEIRDAIVGGMLNRYRTWPIPRWPGRPGASGTWRPGRNNYQY